MRLKVKKNARDEPTLWKFEISLRLELFPPPAARPTLNNVTIYHYYKKSLPLEIFAGFLPSSDVPLCVFYSLQGSAPKLASPAESDNQGGRSIIIRSGGRLCDALSRIFCFRYTKTVVDVGLDMQKYNPEVKPMTNLQNVDPRVADLVDKLRHVHHVGFPPPFLVNLYYPYLIDTAIRLHVSPFVLIDFYSRAPLKNDDKSPKCNKQKQNGDNYDRLTDHRARPRDSQKSY
jgi:hypothetical protein